MKPNATLKTWIMTEMSRIEKDNFNKIKIN